MTTEIKQEQNLLPAFDDLSDITHMLHDVFANIFPNELNSEQLDPHFSQLLTNNGYLRVEDILTAPSVTTITSDVAIIRSAIYSYRGFAVVDGVVKPRGKHENNSVILREVPSSLTTEEVIKIFTDIPNCPIPVSARSDMNNTWFVAFTSEDDAKAAFACTKTISYGGKPLKARLKTERSHQNPHKDIPQLDVNNMPIPPPQHFSPTYPPDMYFPGYLPQSPQYMYPPPFPPQYPPPYDMSIPYPMPPLVFPPFYDPFAAANQHVIGYGNRTPNRGGRLNRNRSGGSYSGRSRDQTSPRYQRNNYSSNSNNGTSAETTSNEIETKNSEDFNDQTDTPPNVTTTSSVDVNEDFTENAVIVGENIDKVVEEEQILTLPSELSIPDKLEKAPEFILPANSNDLIAESLKEHSSVTQDDNEKPVAKSKSDSYDHGDKREPKHRDGDRRNRDKRRSRDKDRNYKGDPDNFSRKEKPKPPKFTLETDFPSLNDNEKGKEKAVEDGVQKSHFNYASALRKVTTSTAVSNVTVLEQAQPAKDIEPSSEHLKHSSTKDIVPNGKQTLQHVTLNGLSIEEKVSKSEEIPKIVADAKTGDLPAPLSFGSFGNATNGSDQKAVPDTIAVTTSKSVEKDDQTQPQTVSAEVSKTVEGSVKPTKKSFIDAVRQNK